MGFGLKKEEEGRKEIHSRAEHELRVTEMKVFMDSGRTGALLLYVVLLTWGIFFLAQDSFMYCEV